MRVRGVRLSATRKTLPILLGVACFAPFGVDSYQFVPFAIPLAIAALGVAWLLSFALAKGQGEYRLWAIGIPFVSVIFATFWSYIFVLRYGGNLLSGALSLRWFLWWAIVPIGLCFRRNGVPTKVIMFWVLTAIVFTLVLFFYRQFTWDLSSFVKANADPNQQRLVRVDDIRGLRLDYPQQALSLIMFLLFSECLYGKKKTIGFLLSLAVIVCYSFVYSRLQLLYSAFALVVYFLIIARRKGATRVFTTIVAIPIGAAGLALLLSQFDVFALGQVDASGRARSVTIGVIASLLPNVFLTGLGVGSYYSISTKQIFGPNFSAADVGLFGQLFTFGLFGVLYVIVTLTMLFKTCHQAFRAEMSSHQPLTAAVMMQALFFIVSSLTFNHLTNADSIAVGAIVLLYAKLRLIDLGAASRRKRIIRVALSDKAGLNSSIVGLGKKTAPRTV